MKLLISGIFGETHIGTHLSQAARNLKIDHLEADQRNATSTSAIKRKLCWLWDHKPDLLEKYTQDVCETCRNHGIRIVVATGLAPLSKAGLQRLKSDGIRVINYLTDNPWNPLLSSNWFLDALPCYDSVFSPRTSVMKQLAALGLKTHYLPFAYAPDYHRPPLDPPISTYDLVFIGGADDERREILSSLLELKIKLGLYGGYWDRYPELRAYHQGFVLGEELRRIVAGSKINLCLVRRANHDDHVMRTFEVPAIGGCMLTEDTPEHRDLLGNEGDSACYFKNTKELKEKIQRLLSDEALRVRISKNAHTRIINGHHTYTDRLQSMLELTGVNISS